LRRFSWERPAQLEPHRYGAKSIAQQSGNLDEPAADSGHLPLIPESSHPSFLQQIINANHQNCFGLRPVKQV